MVDTFVQSGALRATLNHVHAIELNSIRPLLTHTLDQIGRLELSLAHVNRATQGVILIILVIHKLMILLLSAT